MKELMRLWAELRGERRPLLPLENNARLLAQVMSFLSLPRGRAIGYAYRQNI